MNKFDASKLNLVLLTILWSVLLGVTIANYFKERSPLVLMLIGIIIVGLILNFVRYFIANKKK